MTDKMLASVENGIGWLTINNPERRNALSMEMASRGADIIDDFTADTAVRVIVIKGAGDKAFQAGADISEFEKRRDTGPAPGQRGGFQFFETVRDTPKPTIAMIRGYCFGGGVALAAACDLRIVADDAVFAITAGKLGLAYPPKFTRWIVEAVGVATTKEILYTARRYKADEALRIGLATRLVPAAELEAFTREYVRAIVANAPLSVRASKGIIGEVLKTPADWDMAVCESLMKECTGSEDAAEGHKAFLEKRPAVFRGV
jgi:enoyl-CoA hydratase